MPESIFDLLAEAGIQLRGYAAGHEERVEDPPGETDLFAQVSQRYPKQQGLLRARQAFERLAPDRTLADRMVAAIEAQKKSLEWKRENGRFIPSFERWIGEERWNDKLTPEPIYYSHGF